MKTLTKKELEAKGCTFITLGVGAIHISGPIGSGWGVRAKTLSTARKLASKYF